MTVILPKNKVQHFLQLIDSLETMFERYLHRELCEDVKLNVVDGKLVLDVTDTLPDFVKLACQLIFDRTLSRCWKLEQCTAKS